MAAHRSPYAILGLEPGADQTAVDEAYRRLIKLHHPDRPTGDGMKAAEINRAYRELRNRQLPAVAELQVAGSSHRRRSLWPLAIVALACAGMVGAGLSSGRLDAPLRLAGLEERGDVATPIDDQAVQSAVRQALELARTRDERALAEESRSCYRELRARPSVAQLDRCAAYDNAVMQIQDRDPLRDEGPFSALAVTSRQMNAGTALSNDSLAIDSRLDQIRVAVELALAPPEPPPPANVADAY